VAFERPRRCMYCSRLLCHHIQLNETDAWKGILSADGCP
jgi:hypothetical protein